MICIICECVYHLAQSPLQGCFNDLMYTRLLLPVFRMVSRSTVRRPPCGWNDDGTCGSHSAASFCPRPLSSIFIPFPLAVCSINRPHSTSICSQLPCMQCTRLFRCRSELSRSGTGQSPRRPELGNLGSHHNQALIADSWGDMARPSCGF